MMAKAEHVVQNKIYFLNSSCVDGPPHTSSPSVDLLPFGMTIPVTVSQRSYIPEGLMNYPVY
jgi:hypothetical protein